MGKRFVGKKVWITGGGSGLGRAMALEFAREGADVAISGRRAEKLKSVIDELEALGAKALAVPCDVTNEQALEDAVEDVVKAFGALDVAVANAGFGVGGPILGLSAADWRRQLDTNVTGAALTARFAAPELAKTKGRMVFISSVSGLLASPGAGAYSASKFAVRAIGLTLAVEMKALGISSTVIHPGFVESEIGQVDNDGVYHEDWEDKRPSQLMWTGEKAARVMVQAIYKRKLEFVFTGHGVFGAFMAQHFPGFTYFLVSKFFKGPTGLEETAGGNGDAARADSEKSAS